MALLPDSFNPPRKADLGLFHLAALNPTFSDQDFNAVQTSAEQIRHVFGAQNGWPAANISYEENLADLVRHEKEFNSGIAFAYSMLDPTAQHYFGCLYIKPIKTRNQHDRRKELYQAQAFFWLATGQSICAGDVVEQILKTWVSEVFPFRAVAWPGKTPSWDEWNALADSLNESSGPTP